MKASFRCLITVLNLCFFLSCSEHQAHQDFKSKDTSIDNPHKVEDSAKTIIERANQNIKDSLNQ